MLNDITKLTFEINYFLHFNLVNLGKKLTFYALTKYKVNFREKLNFYALTKLKFEKNLLSTL